MGMVRFKANLMEIGNPIGNWRRASCIKDDNNRIDSK
jgi:hypothetical protein